MEGKGDLFCVQMLFVRKFERKKANTIVQLDYANNALYFYEKN